jgi:hypothetical protein
MRIRDRYLALADPSSISEPQYDIKITFTQKSHPDEIQKIPQNIQFKTMNLLNPA